MYKPDSTLNKLQGLICYKTKPNQIIFTKEDILPFLHPLLYTACS